MADVTAIFINFNTKEMVLRAVERARASAQRVQLEVIVVDNSTRPEEKLGQSLLYRLIETENHGFGPSRRWRIPWRRMGASALWARAFIWKTARWIMAVSAAFPRRGTRSAIFPALAAA